MMRIWRKTSATIACAALIAGQTVTAALAGGALGTVAINYTVSVKSAIPATTGIYCTSILTVAFDTGRVVNATYRILATRSGSTASCHVSIPYKVPATIGNVLSGDITYSIEATDAKNQSFMNSPGSVTYQPRLNGGTDTLAISAVL